jgi:hypothetical protein
MDRKYILSIYKKNANECSIKPSSIGKIAEIVRPDVVTRIQIRNHTLRNLTFIEMYEANTLRIEIFNFLNKYFI